MTSRQGAVVPHHRTVRRRAVGRRGRRVSRDPITSRRHGRGVRDFGPRHQQIAGTTCSPGRATPTDAVPASSGRSAAVVAAPPAVPPAARSSPARSPQGPPGGRWPRSAAPPSVPASPVERPPPLGHPQHGLGRQVTSVCAHRDVVTSGLLKARGDIFPAASSRDGSTAEREQQPRRLGGSRDRQGGNLESTRLRGAVPLRIGVRALGSRRGGHGRQSLVGTSGLTVLLRCGKHCRKSGLAPATLACPDTVGARWRVGTRRTRGRLAPHGRRARARHVALRHDRR